MGVRAQAVAALLGVSAGTVGVPGGVVEGIPPRALTAYVQAADSAPCPVPWWDLAAVGAVETGHGTHGGATLGEDGKMTSMAESWAGAKGPMQFVDETWSRYGTGDVNGIDDAAKAAAALLCANGWEQDRTNAFGAYNGGPGWQQYSESRAYVVAIDRFADAYRQAGPSSAPGFAGRALELAERGWVFVGGMAEQVGAGPLWARADRAMFAGTTASSTVGEALAAAARRHVGTDFNPGQPAQCAYFVRAVLAETGVNMPVTSSPLDGWAETGPGAANGFGADGGKVIRDAGALQPGDIVMFANTYGSWRPGTITHVGIYVGGGKMVDRPTASAPVVERPISAFTFVAAVRP